MTSQGPAAFPEASINFRGQVVLVTGAGRGLGRAYSRLIASRGAIVVVHDAGVAPDGTGPDRAVADAVADEIVRAGGTAIAAYEDLAERAKCESLIERILRMQGRLDALILNAGLVPFASIAETTQELYDRTLGVNLGGAYWVARAAMPPMKERRYGRIVLTVSGHGLYVTGAKDLTVYSVSKGALFGLMNALAAEGEPDVLVNAIAPVAATRVYRQAVEAGRLTAEHIAPAAAFLASSACTATGVVLRAAEGSLSLGLYGSTIGVDLGPAVATVEQVASAWSQIASPPFEPAAST
jgi:NAD(P)-dependent dehydrogenase (short-subunit alcohol dehydrogenase family)